jgi:F-box domain
MMDAAKNLRGKRDTISALPDCLLHLIMSFLTARQAVRTCVLSKRWKNLWITLPFLDFNMCEFEDDNLPYQYDQNFRRFSEFVNRTLLLREASDLHKFRLCCPEFPEYWHAKFIRSWIRYAFNHNPPRLGVFSSSSLVNLSLSALYSRRNIIKLINLPCLRQLHLEFIYVNQEFVDKLFCGSPMLQFLHLDNCCMELSSVCSQSLTHLKVNGICSQSESNIIELIDAPNLLFFEYDGCVNCIGHKMHLNMRSLTSACICCFSPFCHCFQYNGKSNIFTGISSVERLELNGRWIKVRTQARKDFCFISLLLNHFTNF